jgi:hypothetical protein
MKASPAGTNCNRNITLKRKKRLPKITAFVFLADKKIRYDKPRRKRGLR